jgi:thiamine biosynthesis lipoprotein
MKPILKTGTGLALALILSACTKRQTPPVERTWLTMGTFASVTLRGDDAAHIKLYQSETQRCFDEINTALTVYSPKSELSQLNRATSPLAVSPQTFTMLQTAIRYAEISSGAFDPTVAPIVRMWGFNGAVPPSNLPSPQAISAALQNTGYQQVRLTPPSTDDPNSHAIAAFNHSGMSIDLGGIAKGFAVDQAYDHLIPLQPANVLINLGGNIRCHGSATPERPWRIGVRNPFDESQTIGILTMQSGDAVATSGNYERYVEIGGTRYAHIIDPRNGQPVSGMAGVTVISKTATEADAISTALFVTGLTRATELLAKLPDSQALLVPDRKPLEIWISPGFQARFTPHAEYKDQVHLLQ